MCARLNVARCFGCAGLGDRPVPREMREPGPRLRHFGCGQRATWGLIAPLGMLIPNPHTVWSYFRTNTRVPADETLKYTGCGVDVRKADTKSKGTRLGSR